MIQNTLSEETIISPSVIKGYIFCPHNVYLKINNVKKTNSSIRSKGISQVYHYLFYSAFGYFEDDKWILFDEANISNSFDEFEKIMNSKKAILGADEVDFHIVRNNATQIESFLNTLKEKIGSFTKRFDVIGIERKLEYKPKNKQVKLLGFVDLVVSDKKSNRIALIDLKNTNKSLVKSSIMSIQFYFYSSLLKKIENLNYYPTFYELNFSNFTISSIKFTDTSPERRLLNITLNELIDSIETNNFPKKIGTNCLECNYSMACRFGRK